MRTTAHNNTKTHIPIYKNNTRFYYKGNKLLNFSLFGLVGNLQVCRVILPLYFRTKKFFPLKAIVHSLGIELKQDQKYFFKACFLFSHVRDIHRK